MAKKLLSKLAWSGIDAFIAAIVTALYNYIVHFTSLPSIPAILPLMLAVAGFGLITYDRISRRKIVIKNDKVISEEEERRIVDKVKNELKRNEQNENEDRFTPTGYK